VNQPLAQELVNVLKPLAQELVIVLIDLAAAPVAPCSCLSMFDTSPKLLVLVLCPMPDASSETLSLAVDVVTVASPDNPLDDTTHPGLYFLCSMPCLTPFLVSCRILCPLLLSMFLTSPSLHPPTYLMYGELSGGAPRPTS
jgi:hypothetical protein